MKKIFLSPKVSLFLLVLLVCGLTIQCDLSQINSQTKPEPFSINESPLPAPTGFINDYAGVIDAATKQRLERRLTQLKAQTNPQVEIAVAIVNTTGGQDIFDYSLAVARGWKIGSKEDDNPSALLFVAVADRKYFTQVSPDLQDELPDGLVGQLQRQYLVPAFKQQNYGKGVEDTIEAYVRTIEGKQTAMTDATPTAGNQEKPARTEESGGAGFGLCNVMVCLIILFILLIIIFSRSGRSRKNRNDRNRWGGGGGFGGGGSALPWIVGSILANSASSSSSSGWSDSSSDWGGNSSSGGWGGFGGGGDFDGGGAGGSW